MKRRILSLIMVLVMTVGFLPAPASAATYLDTRGNWAEEAIDRWSGYGVIQGNNGKFNPGNNLTRAHMAAILSRLLKLPEAVSAGFKDVKSGAWYEDAINRCAAAGIMLGDDGYANPGASITRQQAVVMLARALKIAPIANPDLSGYTDAASVSSYAVGYIAAMAEAGIVRGTSDTNISPYANITRAATVTILHRAIDVYANVPGATVDAEGDGLVLVVADNVTVNAPAGTSVVIPSHISSATVNGKVVAGGQAYEAAAKQPSVSGGSSYVPSVPSTPAAEDLTITESSDIEGGTYRNVTITEAVGNGEVSFTDVTITGNLTILGGGSNTIRMNGCNVHGKVKIDKDSSNNGSQPPRLHLTDTPVPQVEATKPAIIEAGDSSSTVGTLTASDNVTIQGANTKVETVSVPNVSTTPTVTVAEGAQIETVAVAPDATAAVEVNAGASVATVDAKGETIIDAVGTVETVSAAASVTVARGSVDKVEVPAGKTADINVSGSASVATVEAKGETTIKADGSVTEVSAEASVTVASGSVDKMAVPEGKSANVTVSIGAAVISVDIKGETTLNADGTVSSVTASASITISSGNVGRVEIPDDTTDAVSVTVSENATVDDVTVNTTNGVTIDAKGENSVGSVSTDKNDTSNLGKVTIVGGGNESSLQPSSHNWPAEWTYVDSASHQRICQGHPNHRHAQVDVHVWNGGTVTTAPTCTEAGVKTLTCSLCGGTKTTSIAPIGHTIVVDAYQKPTCTQPGMTEGKHCSACNTVLVEQTTIAATGHIWSSDTDPDCNSCGATREVMSEELNQLIAEAEELGLLKYLDKSTLTAGSGVTRLQISMLTGAYMTDIDFTSPLYGADIYDAPAWKFSDGADLTAQQKAVIMTLCSNGILAGYADGTFRSDAIITRGAGTKVLAHALIGQQKADKLKATYTIFGDVTDTVALAPYIEWAAANGIVSGDRNGNFRPYDSLTIEDALRWFIALARDFEQAELLTLIAEAEKLGLLKYLDKDTLVNKPITRMQITMLTGALGEIFRDFGFSEYEDFYIDQDFADDCKFTDCNDLTDQQKAVIMAVNMQGLVGGYADGTFRPDVIPTRGAGTKLLAYVNLGQAKADALVATYTVFSDVTDTVGLAPYIEWAAVQGLADGYGNGKFGPYDSLTVKDALQWYINSVPQVDTELLKLIAEAEKLGLMKYLDKNTLIAGGSISRLQLSMLLGALLDVDTSSAPAWEFSDGTDLTDQQKAVIMVLSHTNIIGANNGLFQPNAPLTRGASTKLLSNAVLDQDILNVLNVSGTMFNDVDKTYIFAAYIELAAAYNIVEGYPDGSFRPTSSLTIKDALCWFINAACLPKLSTAVTNIRFEDQYIKWDQPTAVTEGMNAHYQVRLYDSITNSRSNCGTNRLSVANYAFPKGEYQRIEIATYVDDIEMAVVQAAIDLTITESSSDTTPIVLLHTFDEDGQMACEVTLVHVKENTSYSVHLVNDPDKWNWSIGNFREVYAESDTVIVTFRGEEVLELVKNGYIFVFEQTENRVSSPTEAAVKAATVVDGKPCTVHYGIITDLQFEQGALGEAGYADVALLGADAAVNTIRMYQYGLTRATAKAVTEGIPNPAASTLSRNNVENDDYYYYTADNTSADFGVVRVYPLAAGGYRLVSASEKVAIFTSVYDDSYTARITQGEFTLNNGGTHTAFVNEGTFFIVKTLDAAGNPVYTQYVGMENVPSMVNVSFMAVGDFSEAAEFVYVDATRAISGDQLKVISVSTVPDANCSVTNDAATAENATYSGTVTVVFDSYLYLKDGDTLLQVVDKPIGSMVDNSKYVCSPALVTSSKVEVNPQVSDSAENRYCTTLMLNFTDIRSGEAFTFDQNLANSKGVTGSNVLTLKMRLVPNSDGYYIPEFYVSSTDWDATA